MIGVYSYTVILTYLGLTSSVLSMFFGLSGEFKAAMICLLVSGLCDMFDGKVASTKKNRTETEKKFGIQIDSLCDVVCFSATPAVLFLEISLQNSPSLLFKIFACIAAVIFVLGGVIRLAFFNVEEEERQKTSSDRRTYYRGLPVTSSAALIPFVYVILNLICKFTGSAFPNTLCLAVWGAVLLCLAFLNVLDFRLPKAAKKGKIILCLIGIAVFVGLILV